MADIVAGTWADASDRAIVDAIPQIVWVADRSGAVVYVNACTVGYTGRGKDEILGRGWISVIHPDDLAGASDARERAQQSGEITDWFYRLRRADGEYRHHSGRVSPVRGDAGEIVAWVAVCIDVEDRRREQLRQIFFALLTESLVNSLDPEQTARIVVEACVPELADRAGLYLRMPGGELRLACLATLEGIQQDDQDVRLRIPVPEHGPLGHVAATGLSRVVSAVDEAFILEVCGGDPALLERFRALRVQSVMMVPIHRLGGLIGALYLGTTAASGRRYEATDLAVAEEVALRASTALDVALRFEHEHRVSETFQRAALPPVLPQIPGTFLSATYEAGRAEALVGGDWYDAFRLPDGRLILSVGDVAGSGLDAAVMMASVRQSIRTAAVINPDPAIVLNAVDRIVREIDPDKFVTAFAGLFEPIGGKLRYASAGHPSALLRHPNGDVVALAGGGLPLGLRGLRVDEPSHVLNVEPGSVLLLYTDGLTEVDRDAIAGERRLIAALGHLDPATQTARTLYDALAGGSGARDDIAMLALWFERRLSDVPKTRRALRWRFESADARAAGTARKTCAATLREAGMIDDDVSVAELVLGELLGNVVRYAPGAVEVWLDLSTRAPVLHVLDSGPGFELNPRLPADIMSERGRGLYIVTALVDEFTANRREIGGGGSHVRTVLRGAIR